jgi:transcription elongation GreA/GreB family factor
MSEAAGDKAGTRIEERIEALRLSVDRLAQGLTLMLEAQAAQAEMLRQLLQAASQPASAESPVAQALTKLSADDRRPDHAVAGGRPRPGASAGRGGSGGGERVARGSG